MSAFAERTGLMGGGAPRRYLWTDAFAVCNLFGLSQATGEARYMELALRLVDQVHHTLGRHSAHDEHTGWVSGLDDAAGEVHPTRGGLRIGKALRERRADEAFDERLEWDRDGQYFHYLTKWMHALDQATRATGQLLFTQWARELADAAHRAFVYEPRPGATKRMYWKMSIDLSRPLVASMGQHDPVDGLVTCWQLDGTVARQGRVPEPSLQAAMRDFESMLDARTLATMDPLGLGGLLVDAYRLEQLLHQGALATDSGLSQTLVAAAAAGLRHYARSPELHRDAEHRLAFRELGLAIGLTAVSETAGSGLGALVEFLPMRSAIEAFWLDPAHRLAHSWIEHQDINEVMLATCLASQGFLTLRRPF